MSTEPRIRTELAIAALRLFPREVRVSILEKQSFRTQFGLEIDAVIRLEPGVEIKRSVLFRRAREVLSGAPSDTQIQSKDGRTWLLIRESESEFVLVHPGVRVALPDFRSLDSNVETRLKWFAEQLATFRLNDGQLEKWRTVLTDRPLYDEEVDLLLSEFRLSPHYVAASIRERLGGETFLAADVVPTDLRYFDRLVGEGEEGIDVRTFISTRIPNLIATSIRENKVEGAKAAFALCVHQTVADLIDLSALSREEVIAVFEWLVTHGDMFSKLGAIEFGLRQIETYPELEPTLATLVLAFSTSDPEDTNGRLHVLSALIALVDGMLAHSGHAYRRAVYWRRYAAIVHAGLIEREMFARGLIRAEVADWALDNGGRVYYYNALIDLRREPRWFPDFVAATNLKGEFVGRIAAASEGKNDLIHDSKLRTLLWGEDPGSIKSQRTFPLAYLPGPLEGGLSPTIEIPAQLEEDIRTRLVAETVTTDSFIGLVNSSLVFRITPQLAELAAQTLRRVRYQLRSQRDTDHAYLLLNGLAMTAAITRSRQLADDVRTLARVARQRSPNDFPPSTLARIALTAAASNDDLNQWTSFVGDWFTELAFAEMTIEQARDLLAILNRLCDLEPLLWETCSRSHAALAAFVASFPQQTGTTGPRTEG